MKPGNSFVRVKNSNQLESFERIKCEICGSGKHHPIVSRTDLFLGGDVIFAMQECEKCQAIYQNPRPKPEKMKDYYPPDYQQYTKSLSEESSLTRFLRRYGLLKRGQIITKQVSQGKILDVGGATGDFLSIMREFPGWQTYGIEPTHSALRYAKSKVGLDVTEGVLNVAPFADESFDAITMWDVLEHVYDPGKVLKDVARLLKVGGVFIVNHPNLDSIDRKIFGDLWLGYELPRHLYLFPSNLLKKLMTQFGFEEIRRQCLYGSHAATFSSAMFWVEKTFASPTIHRLARKLLFNVITRLLFLPYFKVIDHFNWGSNITAVFVKTSAIKDKSIR